MLDIQRIVEWIEKEGRVIAKAPVTFAVAVLATNLFVYFVVKGFFVERFEVQGDRLKHAQELNEEYRSKLRGASPDEAAKAIADLQARVLALEPRRLTDAQRQAMRDALKRVRATSIEVAYEGTNPDGRGYAAAFAQLFRESGWNVSEPIVFGIDHKLKPASGIALSVKNRNALSEQERAIVAGLNAAGIKFDLVDFKPRRVQEAGLMLLIATPFKQ